MLQNNSIKLIIVVAIIACMPILIAINRHVNALNILLQLCPKCACAQTHMDATYSSHNFMNELCDIILSTLKRKQNAHSVEPAK